jgi:hypothetical protein
MHALVWTHIDVRFQLLKPPDRDLWTQDVRTPSRSWPSTRIGLTRPQSIAPCGTIRRFPTWLWWNTDVEAFIG